MRNKNIHKMTIYPAAIADAMYRMKTKYKSEKAIIRFAEAECRSEFNMQWTTNSLTLTTIC